MSDLNYFWKPTLWPPPDQGQRTCFIESGLLHECSQSLREELENAPDDDESSDDEVPHPASSDFSYESMIRKVLLDPDDLSSLIISLSTYGLSDSKCSTLKAEIERETSSYSVSPASQGQGQSRASYGSV
eukprot:2540222-Amphidinium_carterae.1